MAEKESHNPPLEELDAEVIGGRRMKNPKLHCATIGPSVDGPAHEKEDTCISI